MLSSSLVYGSPLLFGSTLAYETILVYKSTLACGSDQDRIYVNKLSPQSLSKLKSPSADGRSEALSLCQFAICSGCFKFVMLCTVTGLASKSYVPRKLLEDRPMKKMVK